MIQLIQQPGAVSFARNPMVYALQSDALFASDGAAYAGLLSFHDYATANYAFQLNYGDQQLIFTVPYFGSADESGYYLPSPADRTPQQFMDAVLAALQRNYLLDRDFTLSAYPSGDQLSIRFEARRPGAGYNLSLSDSSHVSIQQLAGGADRVPQPNFKLLVEVWMQNPDGSGYELLSRAFPEVDQQGTCIIDVAGTVAAGLSTPGFDRPSLALAAVEPCPNSIRRFYLKIAEVWGERQVIRAITNTAVKVALLGGFSKRMREKLTFPGYFQAGTLLRFLDQEPTSKVTRLRQPEFLTFCAFNQGYSQLTLQAEIFYNTGGSLHYSCGTLQQVPQYAKICFPAGYSQLNFSLLASERTITSYTLQLTNDQGQPVSEKRTFRLDYTYRPYGRYLVYQNSFGAYVSSFTYGKTSREYELTLQSAEITPRGGFQLMGGERLDYNQQVAAKLSLTTGFISRRALLCFQDLILSPDRFLLDKGAALPVTILSKTLKEFKDGDNLYALAFDLGFAWSEELYTYDPEKPEPYSPADLAGYVPPTEDHTMPVNFDDRYYLKTETYNRVQIDSKLTYELNQRQAAVNVLQQEIDGLNLLLAGKANTGHTHDDRYYTKAQINDFLVGFVGALALEYQAGQLAPIVFDNWQQDYSALGDHPTVIVLEQSPDNPLLYRPSVLQPERLYDANKKLLKLTIDAPQADNGTLRNTLQIILKA